MAVSLTYVTGIMTNMQGVNTDNQLMTSAGKPTALGEKYINASF